MRRIATVFVLGVLLAGCGVGSGLGLVPAGDRVSQMRVPTQGQMSSYFGWRADPFGEGYRFHEGLDYAAGAGTRVVASRGGVVTYAGAAGAYGNLVTVDHGNGIETRYAHLSAIAVRAGQRVDTGQTLGRVGSTGRSTGPHLHFEIRVNGKAVDPLLGLGP